MKTTMSFLLSVLAIALLPYFTSALASEEAGGAQTDGGSAITSAGVHCEVYFAVEGRSSLDVAVEAVHLRQMPCYVIGTNEHCTVVGYQPAAHPTSRKLAKALGLREVPMARHLKPGDVESAAKKALGDEFLKVEGERVFSANVSEFCKGYLFYAVQTKWHSKNPPTNILEEKPLLAMSKDATFLINSYEAALKFLSSFKESVANEAACLSRCMAFLELTNGDLRTRMPLKESIIEMYKKQAPKDWDLVISGTDGGWRVRATASVNKEIDFCIRFEINVGKDGALSLVSRKTIYAYTLYK
jgi:hypothetical protein